MRSFYQRNGEFFPGQRYLISAIDLVQFLLGHCPGFNQLFNSNPVFLDQIKLRFHLG